MSKENFEKITVAGILTGIDKYNFEDWYLDLIDKFKKDYSPEKLNIEENTKLYGVWKFKILRIIFSVCLNQATNENIKSFKRILKKEIGKEFFEKTLRDFIDVIILDLKNAIDLLRGIIIRDFSILWMEGKTKEKAMEIVKEKYLEVVDRVSKREGSLET